jgi:hypothetical protein
MRYILIVFLFLWCSAIDAQQHQSQNQATELQVYDQAIVIAVHDFSKTKLYRMDSVFVITLYDTLHRVAIDTISPGNYKSRRGKAYPNIIAVDILGFNFKYFLDTTVNLSHQKGLPSRFIEQNGKLFIWRDEHFQLADSTIKVLDKYHQIGRGGADDWIKYLRGGGGDELKKAADYYFCRSNLTVYKKKITNTAIGWYEPPNVKCGQ